MTTTAILLAVVLLSPDAGQKRTFTGVGKVASPLNKSAGAGTAP